MWHGQYLVRLFGCAEWNGVHRDCFLSKDQRKRLYKILKFAFLCSLIYLLFFLLPVLLALYLRSHCWVQCHKALPLCFLPRVFIVLGLSFRSLGHLSYFLCISKCVGFFIYYFWLCWVFVAFFFLHMLSLVVASRVYPLLQCAGFSLQWLLLLWSAGSRLVGFGSYGPRAQ